MAEDRELLHKQMLAAMEQPDDQALRAMLADAHAADIAEVFHLLKDEERSRVLYALTPHIMAEVVVLLDEAVRGDVVEDLGPRALGEIVRELPPDDAADMLGEMTEAQSQKVLEHVPDELSDRIEELMEYDEQTAGGIMTTDVVKASASDTVRDATRHVREASPEEELHDIYIVDADDKLVGVVPLRRLVTHPKDTLLEDICDADPVYVTVDEDQEAVVQAIMKYDVSEAAVVDPAGRLVGRITYDDIMDVATEEAEEDIFFMAGTDPEELDTRSIIRAARIRLAWLLPCMVGMLGSVGVMVAMRGHFSLALFAALVLFVPMIGAIGGNSGIQTSTVIVRGFATGELAASKLKLALLREGRIALTMAPVCAVVAWLLVTIGLSLLGGSGNPTRGAAEVQPLRVAAAVASGMFCAIIAAAGLGIFLPFGFRKLGVDPAIASGPLVTTLNDIVSVTVYLSMALAIA